MPKSSATHRKRKAERDDAWINKLEAAAHAGVGWRTLNEWISGRKIPKTAQPLRYSRLPSGRLRFQRKDIDEFLLQFSHQSKMDNEVVDKMVDRLFSDVIRMGK